MTAVLDEFIRVLSPKVSGILQGTAKLVIIGEGTVLLDTSGAQSCAQSVDTPADVTLAATQQVFRAIMDGSQNPVMAFMSGKLKVEGSPQRALKVSAILVG